MEVICIGCGQPALARCRTKAGKREVEISKLCEPCFFEWAGAPEPAPEANKESEWTPA